MFGRGKSEQTQDAVQAGEQDGSAKSAGKGRPTPKRREAEQRGRNPVIRNPQQAQLAKNATKAEKKAARDKERQARRQESLQRRQALMSGDERYLPERDRGPARRWVRDYVDARWSVGEFFIPVAVAVIVLGFLPRLVIVSTVLLYGLVLLVAVDSFLLRRRIKTMTVGKFGEARAQGAATYAMLRALQIRRTRLPRPTVPRGRYPS